jgi:hypothetical protein
MSQYFICRESEVEFKIKHLIRIGESEDGYILKYKDEKTGEHWSLAWFESELLEKDIPVLQRLPEATTEELIKIAMSAQDIEEIVGASLLLSAREGNRKEDFRADLLQQLLQVDLSKASAFEQARLRMIIYESDLLDTTNRREIIGKHFTQINRDADYYRGIAKKAIEILHEIKIKDE